MEDIYEVITWPDIQAYMELEGFEDNACLADAHWCVREYGSSAYFVRKSWLESLSLNDRVKAMEVINPQTYRQ